MIVDGSALLGISGGFWVVLEGSWRDLGGLLGESWGGLGGVLGGLGGVLGEFWVGLGGFRRIWSHVGPQELPLEALLGPIWSPSWGSRAFKNMWFT